VFVTHHIDEAIFLADRVLVLTARPAACSAALRLTCLGREIWLAPNSIDTG